MGDLTERTNRCGCGKGLSEEVMSKLGIYTFSYFVQDNFILCSDNLVKKYGVLPEYDGNTSQFIEDFLSEDNHPIAREYVHKVKEGSDQKALFMTRVGRDVVNISLLVREKNSDGEVTLAEGVIETVTESILMDKEKRTEYITSNRMLNTAIRAIYPVGIAFNLTKNQYRFIYFDGSSKEEKNKNGTDIDALLKESLKFIPDSESRKTFEDTFSRNALMRAYAAGKKEVKDEHTQLREDGEIHWVESRCIFVEGENGDVCAIALSSNIDEKKNQEKEIREQLEIVDALSRDYLNVYIIDLKRDRLRIVKSLGTVPQSEFERDGDEFVYSKSFDKFIRMRVHPDDVDDVIQQVSIDFMKMTFKRSSEYASSCKVYEDGDIHYYQYKFVKLKKSDRNIAIMAFQNIDKIVAREKQMNEELRKAMKEAEAANEAKSNFFFNMSHDIRTPMNAILGSANLLKQTEGDIEKQRKYVDNICVSGKYLLELINGVLEMSRIESGNLSFDVQCMNLYDLTKSVATIFEGEYKNKKLNIVRDISYDHPYIFADFTKCQEITLNIISNAIKYTPEGGTITITSKEIFEPNNGYGFYETIIEDTGIGISPDYLPHIFDRFSRERTYTENKIVGTGLGMGITKKLVEGMNGTIKVESKLGKGTKVTYMIPFKIADEAEVAKEKIDLSLEFTGETKRILLAEDNELNSDIAIALLESRGFEVDLARDGVECFELLDDHDDDYYDLILMDIQMPRMDGYQTTKRIRALSNPVKSSIPIIAMTANVFDEDRNRAFKAGMNGFTGKPIEVQLLFGEIGRLLRK